MNWYLKSPKIDLYAYQLCHDLSEGELAGQGRLWERIRAVGEVCGISALQSLPQLLVPYQEGTKRQVVCQPLLPFQGENIDNYILRFCHSDNLSGGLVAYRLHDTLIANLMWQKEQEVIPIGELDQMNPQGCLLPQFIQPSIGQTLILYAQPLSAEGEIVTDKDSLREIAQQCYFSLLHQNPNQHFNQKEGTFLDSPIFEFENSELDPFTRHHVLIWLVTNSTTIGKEVSGDYCDPLLNLLCYRHKNIFSFDQGRRCYFSARECYLELERLAQKFKQLKQNDNNEAKTKEEEFKQREERVDKLESWLYELPTIDFRYVDYVRDLEAHITSIELNSHNYSHWLDKLHRVNQLQDDLNFWSDEEWQTFHSQMKGDIAYLSSMKNLAVHLVNSIRGIVQIDSQRLEETIQKQEKERADRLSAIVTIASSGLAVSGISTAVKAEIVCSVNGNAEIPIVYLCYIANVATHALFGLVVAFLVWFVIEIFRSHK